LTVGQVRAAIERVGRELLRELAEHDFAVAAIDDLLARRACSGGELARSAAGEPCLADLRAVLHFACAVLVPNLARTTDEMSNLLAALNGRFVPAGPSGAPTRGMAHVLPTGRNFYTVDPRGLPTHAAWTTGLALTHAALDKYFAEAGEW